MLDAAYYILTIMAILGLGLWTIITKKNAMKTILMIETMLAAVNLNFVQFAARNGNDPVGHSVVVASIAIGAGLLAFSLALAVKNYRSFGTLDVSKYSELKG